MQRKIFIGCILIFVLSLALLSCSKKSAQSTVENAEDSEPSITIKLSMVFAPEEELTAQIIAASERIRERTGGKVDIQVFPSNQLPAYKDSMEQVLKGANWIAVEDPTYVGDYVPDFGALVGPMLYNTYDEYEAMVKTAYVKGLIQQAEDKDIKILALDYIFGFRNVVSNKEITVPADLNGLKIRVPKSKLFIDTLKAMGADATPIAFSETYSGIQQGVVDGYEGSINTQYANKMYEVSTIISETKHFIGTAGVYISKEVFEGLSPKQQEIVQEEISKGAAMNNQRLRQLDEEYVVKLKELGTVFHPVDYQAFADATADIYNTFPGWTPGVYDTMLVELNKIRN